MAAEDDMIKRIRIQNFRSLVDVTVDLDPLTVLIGRSGTGKSNFVEAIRFLRDSLNSRTVNFQPLGGLTRTLHVYHLKEPLVYEVSFTIPGDGKLYHYRLDFHNSEGRFGESLSVDSKELFRHSHGKWQIAPHVTPTPKPAGIMLGAIPGLQESTFAYVALRSGIGCYDFPGSVLTGEGKKGQPLDGGFADRGENYLLVADRILSDLARAPQWTRMSKVLRALNKTVSNLTLNVPAADRIDVALELGGPVLTFDVRQESEGFRRFLAHLLALYQTPSKQTLIFEHPETGLHPGALYALAEEFKDCPEDGRGQVILTTHSPEFLHHFPAGAIRVVDIEGQGTRIGPLAPEQMRSVQDHLLMPGELLTVDPARLEGQLSEVSG
jgi:predicted ATPase